MYACLMAGVLGFGFKTDAKPSLPKGPLTYEVVRPFLKEKCFKCHAGDTDKGGLLLDTYVGLMQGGDDGVVIKKGDGEGSLLIRYLWGTIKPRMPKNADPIQEVDIKALSNWVNQGAKERKTGPKAR